MLTRAYNFSNARCRPGGLVVNQEASHLRTNRLLDEALHTFIRSRSRTGCPFESYNYLFVSQYFKYSSLCPDSAAFCRKIRVSHQAELFAKVSSAAIPMSDDENSTRDQCGDVLPNKE